MIFQVQRYLAVFY